MKNRSKFSIVALIAFTLLILNSQFSTALAQGTAFTYQGRLNDNGVPANGAYDLVFTIYASSNGLNDGFANQTNLATSISNGLFTVTLDPGVPGIFTGPDRWLEIDVRTNGNGAFTTLTPRQKLTPTPYAIFANTASNLSGTIANGALPSSPIFSGTVSAGSFAGNGANLTSLNAGNISGGTLDDAQLSANVALLNRDGQIFTGGQTFNGVISLNSSNGFHQSSVGNFYVDAPFIVGGRFTVLTNGNVGIGTNNPSQKLQVIGNATLTGALNLPSPATINVGANRLLYSDGANQNFFAGQSAAKSNTSGGNDTADGYQALFSNTTGGFNTATGDLALYSNTTGTYNTANGALALYSNTNGNDNTASGFEALYSSASANDNTAYGYQALYADSSGNENTAIGVSALGNNNASGNTAVGYQALATDGAGSGNTALGVQALQNNTSGLSNTGLGGGALESTTTGSGNIGIGSSAGYQLSGSGSYNIDIGSSGSFTDSNTIRIGGVIHHQTFIAGISGVTVSSGVQVYVDGFGQLGTLTSSKRFKQNIRGMGEESDVLLSLRPVAFQYKPEFDPQGIPQFGLIAEEVEKVAPDLVARDASNQVYTVRYQAVSAMLLNEFLKQHQTITGQCEEIQCLKEQNQTLQTQLDNLEQMVQAIRAGK